jgi:hypothetical protein
MLSFHVSKIPVNENSGPAPPPSARTSVGAIILQLLDFRTELTVPYFINFFSISISVLSDSFRGFTRGHILDDSR